MTEGTFTHHRCGTTSDISVRWLAKRIRNTGYLAFLKSHVKIFSPRTRKTMRMAFRYLLYAALCSWWYVTLHVVVGDLKSLHTESEIFASKKLNTTSRWVNHVYTLPPKLSSIIKHSDQVQFSAFLASSASILIEKNAYENFGPFSQIFKLFQSRKLCVYLPSPISRNPEHNKKYHGILHSLVFDVRKMICKND